MTRPSILKKELDALCRSYGKTYLSTDPLMFLHRYDDPDDIEVVGLICASLAYGHVKIIKRSIQRVLDLLGKRPAEYVCRFDAGTDASAFSRFSHRFNRGHDIALLLHYMKQMIETEGSIGGFFRKGYRAADPTIGDTLADFVDRTLALDCMPVYSNGVLPHHAGVRFFFPSPSRGSACKRLNLYLRWMIRNGDGLDLGLWDFALPAQLVIPLDTHIARICRLIGFTKKKTPGWSMAVEITERLSELDPHDPVRYDFAICRLGILDRCPRISITEKCIECQIRNLCLR